MCLVSLECCHFDTITSDDYVENYSVVNWEYVWMIGHSWILVPLAQTLDIDALIFQIGTLGERNILVNSVGTSSVAMK